MALRNHNTPDSAQCIRNKQTKRGHPSKPNSYQGESRHGRLGKIVTYSLRQKQIWPLRGKQTDTQDVRFGQPNTTLAKSDMATRSQAKPDIAGQDQDKSRHDHLGKNKAMHGHIQTRQRTSKSKHSHTGITMTELEQTKWLLRQTQQLAVHKQPLRHRQQPCNHKLLGQKRRPTKHKRQQIGNE